jgi:hypothetical protein
MNAVAADPVELHRLAIDEELVASAIDGAEANDTLNGFDDLSADDEGDLQAIEIRMLRIPRFGGPHVKLMHQRMLRRHYRL